MSALQSPAVQPQPSPATFFDAVQGYQRSFILKAAVDLDLFTAIAHHQHTVAEIAHSVHASERGVRVLLDCLTVLGFLTKSNNRYSLTADSAFFLDSRSPAYLGRAVKFLLDPSQLGGMRNLAETVRQGHAPADSFAVAAEDQLWVDFARGMAPLMFPAAQAIAQLLKPALAGKSSPKILDIAAGHGTFGITVAEHFPNAEIHAVDWQNVLAVAQENARSHRVSDRYHLLPGSAFEVDFGSHYDAALVTNFLHHFDEKTNVTLLKKVHAALQPSGQAVILEFVPDEDRVSPPIPAMFSVTMLAGTPNGDAYTFSQLSEMCRAAGFEQPKLVPLEGFPQSLLIARKPS